MQAPDIRIARQVLSERHEELAPAYLQAPPAPPKLRAELFKSLEAVQRVLSDLADVLAEREREDESEAEHRHDGTREAEADRAALGDQP